MSFTTPFVLSLCLVPLTLALAEPPTRVQPTPADRAAQIKNTPWFDLIEQELPPLKNKLGDRWPLIVWHGPGYQVLTPAQINILMDRGLTQHLPMNAAHVEAAQALQQAGARVILMEGKGGNWPYSAVGDSSRWAIRYTEGFTLEMAGKGPIGTWHGAVPTLTEGWAHMAEHVRNTLRAFRDAGVQVHGVWMDWEGDPYPFGPYFAQLQHCANCAGLVPEPVLKDRPAWFAYCWQRYTQLHDAYLAAPTREIFPNAAVTNWHIVFSSAENPVIYFVDDRVIPPAIPANFTASNPVAYGNDKWWMTHWKKEYPLDRWHVDQFYMHNLLRQISVDTANRQAYAPYSYSFPWVGRWVPILGDAVTDLHDMSRAAYREALRHMWLRGVTGLQVFAFFKDGYEDLWLKDLQDNVAVYDEILAHSEFLDGEPMNLGVPAIQDDGVLWSGLRLGNRALVRAYSQGATDRSLGLEPWPGTPIALSAPRTGKTYVLERSGNKVRILD